MIIREWLDIIGVNHQTWLKSNGKHPRIVQVSLQLWLCSSDLPVVKGWNGSSGASELGHWAIGGCDGDNLQTATKAHPNQRSLD